MLNFIQRLFILFILVCSLSSYAQEIVYPDWFRSSFLDLSEDLRDTTQGNRHLVILFHQEGCPYCQALVERNFSQNDIVQLMHQSFDVVAINLWGALEVRDVDGNIMTESDLGEKYSVQYTPTLLFLDQTGAVKLRLNGYQRPPVFKTALQYIVDNSEQSYIEYLQQQPIDQTIPLRMDSALHHHPESIKNAINPATPYALLFDAGDCLDCTNMHDTLLTHPTTRNLMTKLPVLHYDRWSNAATKDAGGIETTARKLADRLAVDFTPTWIFFDGNDEEILRVESTVHNFHMQAALEYVVDSVYQNEPNFQRYIQTRGDRIRAAGDTVNLTE